ncbi:hypothetical protein V6U89_18830 [Micromonospora sp. CPCC 206171]|uniref:hypothetical protein n=1 Tax=Micromonospora sp. CPCC 206171 TaxID=3122405 RepID=UPI002FEF951B
MDSRHAHADLHMSNDSSTRSAPDMFDRFLGWPARHSRSYDRDRLAAGPGGMTMSGTAVVTLQGLLTVARSGASGTAPATVVPVGEHG